jgi:general secretion pathway protein L
MANHIIGLDIGTHSVKVVRVERGREPRIIGYDEEPIDRLVEESSAPAGEDDFERAPTQVRHKDELAGPPDGGQPSPEAEASGDGEGFGPPAGEQAESAAPEAADPSDQEAPAAAPEASAESTRAGWELAVERLIERGAFDDDGLLVTFLPDDQAMSIHQKVPFDERAKVENILSHMLDDRLPVDTAQVVYDFQLIKSTVEEGAEAVIGFARKENVGRFLAQLKDQHLDPAVLGIPELLLTYGLERATGHQGTYALVDIGHRNSRVLVLHEREPAVARSVKFGGVQLTEAITEQFEASWEQAENVKENHGALVGPDDAPTDNQRVISDCLERAMQSFVRDLRRTFQSLYAHSRIEIDEVFLCGGTSRLGGICEFLSREFGVQVSLFPTQALPGMSDSGADGRPLQMVMAASAAFQQIDGREEERLIDLRKQEFTYRGKSSYLRSQMVKFGAVAAVLFALAVAMLMSQKFELETQRDTMRQALHVETTELFGEPVFTSDEITGRLTGQEAAEGSYIPRMSAYQLYYELASRIDRDTELTVTRFEIDVDRDLAQLYGETDSPQSVERLMEDLRGLECLRDVRQDGELKIRGDDAVDFHLHISSNCS